MGLERGYMIVLKATQDKVLRVLQSVAGIVEQRHTLPILANVLLRKSEMGVSSCVNAPVQRVVLACRERGTPVVRRSESVGLLVSSARPNGFFAASKANLRNAP